MQHDWTSWNAHGKGSARKANINKSVYTQYSLWDLSINVVQRTKVSIHRWPGSPPLHDVDAKTSLWRR